MADENPVDLARDLLNDPDVRLRIGIPLDAEIDEASFHAVKDKIAQPGRLSYNMETGELEWEPSPPYQPGT